MTSLSSLRDLQFQFNKIKSQQLARLEVDYKGEKQVPTIRWVINERDIERRRQEVELSKLYKDAYLAWDNYYGGDQPSGNTMVFKRFPALSVPEHELDILVKAFLGFPQPMGYKQGRNNVILNDAWTINLRSERENTMMDQFLKGFAGQAEELKKAWEGKQMIGIDVSSELEDLLKVYTDAEQHLSKKEQEALNTLEAYMKRYTDAKEERKKVSAKLNALKEKMSAHKPCDSCGEDHDDEDEEE